ncbi:hypothetical protein GGF50DRAFT_86166 [Schizophyllum commune]
MSCEQDLSAIHNALHARALHDFREKGIIFLPSAASPPLPDPYAFWAFDDFGDIVHTPDDRDALLAYVGRINPDCASFSPDGRRGENIEDAAISFRVGLALSFHGVFLEDSIKSNNIVNALKGIMTVDGLPIKKGIHGVPVFHPLFEKIPLQPTLRGAEHEQDNTLPSWWSLETWPARDANTRNDIQRLRGQYQLSPLPAYDEHGNLLAPHDYESALPGALVCVLFKLRHTFGPTDNGHYFNFDLHELSIIRRGPASRRRRTLPQSAVFPLPRIRIRQVTSDPDNICECSDMSGSETEGSCSEDDGSEFPILPAPLASTSRIL